ncbi:MAG: tetratricopeptide repeat protein [Halobacteriales archaeon]|nr:tetratricopeptide repeat protein [Halobacteriales archaeon]
MGGLPSRLQRVLGPLPPHVARAFVGVAQKGFLPPSLSPLAGCDAPLPFLGFGPEAALTPSPRVLALLLQALEPERAGRVLIVGAESGYMAALCLAAGAQHVRIVEPSRECADAAQGFLAEAGLEGKVDVRTGPPVREAGEERWDRILLLDPRRELGALGERMAEMGFALAMRHTAEAQGFELVRTLRSGPTLVELRVQGMPLPGFLDHEASILPRGNARTLHGLLALEEMAQNAWRGQAPTRPEEALRRGVEDTWARPPADLEQLSPAVRERRALAKRLFHVAYVHQACGDLSNAAELYQRSNALLPSSEAHTFLGWVRSLQGQLDDAIRACRDAIAVDPSLGNPYNDIGAYLLQQQRFDEVEEWLQRALKAERYDAPFFPHPNLARLCLARGDARGARAHVRKALELNPEAPGARELLAQLGERDEAAS